MRYLQTRKENILIIEFAAKMHIFWKLVNVPDDIVEHEALISETVSSN